MIGLKYEAMVKEQTSSSQDVCVIQWIKTDYVHLWAIIQHFVFPLLLSVYSNHIYCTQYSCILRQIYSSPQSFSMALIPSFEA